MSDFRVAIDIGGTFTDIVVFDEQRGRVEITKVPSTPDDLSRGVLDGLRTFMVDLSDVGFFVHGTTAGLNAFLQRRGARTALVTTAGFRDVYEIGRSNRPDMYNLHFHRPKRLVPRRHVYEVWERIRADGTVDHALDEGRVGIVIDAIEADGFEAVAVCLLHAYANPAHEMRIADLLRCRLPDISISVSHQVAPEWREYERTSTTVMNAYVAPVMASYLTTLEEQAARAGLNEPIFIMQSTGGLIPSATAKQMAVQTIMSGPVGGTMGGSAVARELNRANLLCVDMGGTSFDMSLIVDGHVDVTPEAELEGVPLLVPMIQIHTIGAGGGSLAWTEGGGLRVGPHSAGSSPGPACYGLGGTEPTVTDANLVLGRIDPATFLGGRMPLDRDRALAAIEVLGAGLGLDALELSEGICRIVNANMAGAIRQITIERGIDPREFTLVAFGGAGPMHAVFIARELDIREIVVPRSPGAFSAWGMLQADLRRDFVRAFYRPVDSLDLAELDRTFAELESDALRRLAGEHFPAEGIRFARSADLRYVGQEHSLGLALPADTDAAGPAIADRFHALHERRYGHSNPRESVEFVNLRLAAISPLPKTEFLPAEDGQAREAQARAHRPVYFDGAVYETAVYLRSELAVGNRFSGPAIVEEESCTTVIPAGYRATVDRFANIVIRAEG